MWKVKLLEFFNFVLTLLTSDRMAIMFLGLAMLMSLWLNPAGELATHIASGLIGFIGKGVLTHTQQVVQDYIRKGEDSDSNNSGFCEEEKKV